jgi:hypothetical protein
LVEHIFDVDAWSISFLGRAKDDDLPGCDSARAADRIVDGGHGPKGNTLQLKFNGRNHGAHGSARMIDG